MAKWTNSMGWVGVNLDSEKLLFNVMEGTDIHSDWVLLFWQWCCGPYGQCSPSYGKELPTKLCAGKNLKVKGQVFELDKRAASSKFIEDIKT